MKNIKKILIPSIIALIHMLLTFITDRFYFVYQFYDKKQLLKLLVFKFCLLIILTLFYYFVVKFIKNKLYKRDYFKIFIVVFAISMIFLLLTWPGVLRNDEIGIILYAKTLKIESWHHILISILIILELMLIPFPTGVIIVNCFIYSMIIAYIVSNLSSQFKNIKYRYIVLLIPFLLIPVLENNLYPLRPILYGYLESFWFFYIYFNYKSGKKLTYFKFFMIIILSILLIALRSEAICYIPLVIIVYFLMYKKKKFSFKKFILATALFLIGYFSINILNEKVMIKNYGNSYQLTATYGFVRKAARIANENNDKVVLEKLNKGFDIKGLVETDNWVGAYLNKNITYKETKDFFNAYYKIVFNNLDLFVNERIDAYIKSNGFIKNINLNIFTTYNLFDDEKGSANAYAYKLLMYTEGRFIRPINRELRKNVICFLEGKNTKDETNLLFTIFWNSFIPTLFVLIFTIACLIKKRFLEMILGGFALLKTFLIFMTVPESYFMYYFSIYLLGYVLLMVMILSFITNKKDLKVK